MPDTVELDDLRDQFVFCRTYGHSWDEFNPDRKPHTFQYYTALRCTRCGTKRFDYEGALGEIIDRGYEYPEGYALAGSLTRAQFRLEWRRRKRTTNRRKR